MLITSSDWEFTWKTKPSFRNTWLYLYPLKQKINFDDKAIIW